MFVDWMHLYGKSYHHEEFQQRFSIWKANLDFIDAHNAEGHSYTVAMNKFGDLTSQEYQNIYLGLKLQAPIAEFTPVEVEAALQLPASKDWRQSGAVTPVKNQEQCGSCWSFSTTGSTEGCHAISGKSLVSLSEQNLIDCSSSYGNDGCNGGLMTSAMQYIIANKGIDTEVSYPYEATDGSCAFSASEVGATLSAFTNVQQGNEADLQNKANLGPVSVAIDASQPNFQFYSGGVYSSPQCSQTQLDHGVLVVGWGVSGSSPYWIVKNSWGAAWGLQGYIWMSRNNNNNCGIATMATLPNC
jgi:cathepsin L